MIEKHHLRVYASISALTLVAWGAILLVPNALYWDDWVTSGNDTLRMTSEGGLPWVGYYLVPLYALGPWTFKVLVLISAAVLGCLRY